MDLEKIWDLRVKDKIIKSASWKENEVTGFFVVSQKVLIDFLSKVR